MIIINGVVYANQHELARALATDPDLRALRNLILAEIVQRPDSPVSVNARALRPIGRDN